MAFSPDLSIPVSIKNPETRQVATAILALFKALVGGINDASVAPLVAATVPTTSTFAGNIGQVSWDTSFFYLCYAPNKWARIAWTSISW